MEFRLMGRTKREEILFQEDYGWISLLCVLTTTTYERHRRNGLDSLGNEYEED
jgi:hypothetical protein